MIAVLLFSGLLFVVSRCFSLWMKTFVAEAAIGLLSLIENDC